MNDKKTNSDEKMALMEAFKDVRPIQQDDKISVSAPKKTLAQSLKRQALELSSTLANNYLSVENVEPIDPYDHISFKQDGVQDGVFKNLRLAKYHIDLVLNLQQMKFEKARSLLFNQIITSHQKGHRMLLIKHGLGLQSSPFPAYLKSYLNKWLQQMPEVIAFHTAQAQHGGNGSVYVLLKKNQTEKANNRERFARR